MEMENGNKLDDNNRKGDLGEVIAKAWFLSQGWDVFPNECCTGPIDIVAINIKTGQIILVDCKTHSSSKLSLTPLQIELGVKLLFINIKTGQCSFYHHDIWDTVLYDNIRQDFYTESDQRWIDEYWLDEIEPVNGSMYSSESVSGSYENAITMEKIKKIAMKNHNLYLLNSDLDLRIEIPRKTGKIYEEVKEKKLTNSRKIREYLDRIREKRDIPKKKISPNDIPNEKIGTKKKISLGIKRESVFGGDFLADQE